MEKSKPIPVTMAGKHVGNIELKKSTMGALNYSARNVTEPFHLHYTYSNTDGIIEFTIRPQPDKPKGNKCFICSKITTNKTICCDDCNISIRNRNRKPNIFKALVEVFIIDPIKTHREFKKVKKWMK